MAQEIKAKLLGITRSSNQDVAEGYGPAIQEAEIITYAANGYELIGCRQVIEPATLDLEDRELFKAVLAEAIKLKTSGQCDGLVFSRCDRLSRKMEGAMQVALDLKKVGLEIHLIRENQALKPDDQPLNFVMFILHAFGVDSQTRIFLKNTKEGQRKAAKAGKLPSGVGRGIKGLNLVGSSGDKHFEINGDIALVKLVLELGKTESLSEITRVVRAKGFLMTRRMVQNILGHARLYAGEYVWSDIPIPNLIPPVITMEEALAIEARRRTNQQRSYGYGKRNWLSGRVKCGLCGRTYRLSPVKNYAVCPGHDRLGTLRPCIAPHIRYNDLDYAVRRILVENVLNSKFWRKEFEQIKSDAAQWKVKLQAEIAESNDNLKRLEDRRDRLSRQHEMRLLSDEELKDKIIKMVPEWKLCQERAQELKARLNNPPPTPPDLEELTRITEEMGVLLDDKAERDAAGMKLAEKFDLEITLLPTGPREFKLKIFANIPLSHPERDVFTSKRSEGKPVLYDYPDLPIPLVAELILDGLESKNYASIGSPSPRRRGQRG